MSGYTHTAAYDSGRLPVSDLHTLHYEQYGQGDGKPVLFLHGGPGGSTSIANTAFFDPAVYRVVLYDQRGAGKSTPAAELHENETSYLLADIEVLREHLRIPKWHVVFGGSWGSTLALLYAQAHPERIISLVLRGIFLARKSEIAWDLPTRESGAAQLFPDAAEEMLSHFTEEEQEDVMASLYKRLVSDDKETRVEAARVSNTWDIKRSSLLLDSASLSKIDDEKWSLQHAILENHFLINGAWLREGQILEKENVDKIRHLPCVIIQGRYDSVCPPQSAWDLYKAWPTARLVMVPDAGHSATDPGIFKELVKACDDFAALHG